MTGIKSHEAILTAVVFNTLYVSDCLEEVWKIRIEILYNNR